VEESIPVVFKSDPNNLLCHRRVGLTSAAHGFALHTLRPGSVFCGVKNFSSRVGNNQQPRVLKKKEFVVKRQEGYCV
jgi:hypothetical protein